MAGIIAIAIRINGNIRTVHLGKGALNMMRDVDFLTNPAKHELWTRRVAKGGTPENHPGPLLSSPAQPLAPVQYGLVVVDFDRKWVGDLQNFTTLFGENTDTALSTFRRETIALAQAGRCVLHKYGEDASGQTRDYLKDVVLSEPDGRRLKEDVGVAAQQADAVMIDNNITPLVYVGLLCARMPQGWTHDSYTTNKAASGWPRFIEDLAAKDWPVFDLSHQAAWREYQEDSDFPVQDFDRLESSWRAQHLDKSLPARTKTTPSPRM